MASYENLKVLVVRENWLGCTGLSAFNALVRAGAQATSITEGEYFPRWSSLPMRVLRRVIRRHAVWEFNAALLADARRYRPDLLLVFKGVMVRAETLRAIGRMGITRYCFFPDVSFDVHGPCLPEALPCYDWIFSTKSFGPGDLKTLLGIDRAGYLPHAYDPDVHRPRDPEPRDRRLYGCDVSFIGAWSEKKARLLEGLIALRPGTKLKIWGDRWQNLAAKSPLRAFTGAGAVYGPAYAMAVSCSKINLGLVHERVGRSSSGDRITSRTFHIPACGGLMAHERTGDLLDIFTEDESCLCFDGAEELAGKVEALLDDEPRRRTIALRGRELVTAAHSWDHRAKTILNHFLGSCGQAREELPGAA